MLFSAMKQAVRWQLIPRNPVEAVDKFKETKWEIKVWESSEAAHFLDVAHAHRLYAAFYLEMATGLRRGELLGLRWEDVRNNIIFVRQQLSYSKGKFVFKDLKTKNGKRLIPVSPDAIAVLERHRKVQEAERLFLGEEWPGYDLVFTSEVGTPIQPRNFHRVWVTLKGKANVPQVRLHDLRHLYASVCVQAGVDPKLLASWLGQDTGGVADKDLEQGEDEDDLN